MDTIVIFFVFFIYLISHIYIGLLLNKKTKIEGLAINENILKFLFKWWPAVWVLIVIVLFYII